jgi:hypothetical protein
MNGSGAEDGGAIDLEMNSGASSVEDVEWKKALRRITVSKKALVSYTHLFCRRHIFNTQPSLHHHPQRRLKVWTTDKRLNL